MLTVESLARGLRPRARRGRRARRRPRSAGSTSPSSRTRRPWLSGGELLLTTGIQPRAPRPSSAASSGCSPSASSPGSGSAPASTTSKIPKALLDEAATRDLPLFEVPYEMPFIAITERAFGAAGQRAVRGARARHRGARAARAAGARGPRPRGDPRARRERRSAAPPSSSTPPGASSPAARTVPTRPRRGGDRGARARSRRPADGAPASPFAPSQGDLRRAGARDPGLRPRAAARRSPGWW